MTDYVRKPPPTLEKPQKKPPAAAPKMAAKTPEKTIVGAIPAIPGLLPNVPLTIEVEKNEDHEVVAGDRSSVCSTSSQVAASVPPPKPVPRWCLRHQDFMPNLIKEKTLGDDEYEKFHVLVERGNKWLSENRWAHLMTCETVLWMSSDKAVYHDNGVMQKSMSGDKKTKMIRGLRLWYFALDDTFYAKENLPPASTVCYMNCTLDPKSDSLKSMVKKLNKEMFKKPFPGKIVRVETVNMNADISDPDVCFWKEQPDKDRQYYFFLRVYYVEKMDESITYGELGIRDFVPQFDQRSPHSSGHEVFSDVWKKAARWFFINPKNNILNLQSVYVKYKKGDNTDVELWDRCTYKEHGSAHGSLSNQKTDYLQILRVYYHFPIHPKDLSADPPVPRKIFYKNFSPAKLKKPGTSSDEKEDLSESSFEDLRMVDERLNSWMQFSGAQIFGVETVMSRLSSGGQETIGPEATFAYNSRDKCQGGRELWRNTMRIHIHGDFTEVPTTWRRTMVDASPTGGTQ